MSGHRVSAALAAAVIVLVSGGPAAAWEGDDANQPSGAPFDPPPFDLPAELPDTGPVATPAGIYAVTDAYTGDFVTHDGAVTTYGTATVHGPTDTFARVIDTVATGAGSIFDGAAFNGRSALTDGRAVAGTYYENFFLTAAGYVSFGIVFFQDDAEIARAGRFPERPTAPVPPPTSAPVALPSDPSLALPVAPSPTLLPGPSLAPAALPLAGAAPAGAVAPRIEVPVPGRDLTPPAGPSAGEPLAGFGIEVLRGRRAEIWLIGLPAGSSWRYLGGEAVVIGPRAGAADAPFIARWDRLAPPGAAWPLRFAVAGAGGPQRTLVLEVTVRSPGLVE